MSNDEIPFQLPNFEMQRLLGRGGMASVWLARQISLDRPVAVKVLAPEFASSPEDVAQFRREARAAAQLKHIGIVEVYDANCINGYYYFVMEFVDGYTMGDLLRRKGQMAMDDALIVLESVALAMDYAWSQFKMVHNDIKPDNIMVDADGTVKVTDLGLCRSLTASRDSVRFRAEQADEIFGTPGYMSPEQIYGVRDLDCRSDIYELGATIYHLVTGQMLFNGKTDEEMLHCHVEPQQAPDPRQFQPALTNAFVMMLEKMLVKDRNRRTSDWRKLISDIHRVNRGQPPAPALIAQYGSSLRRDR